MATFTTEIKAASGVIIFNNGTALAALFGYGLISYCNLARTQYLRPILTKASYFGAYKKQWIKSLREFENQ